MCFHAIHLTSYSSLSARTLALGRLFCVVLLVDILAFALWYSSTGSEQGVVHFMTAETGILEVMQVLLLALSVVLCFYAATVLTSKKHLGSILNTGLGLFFMMLLLRELEIDKFGSSVNWVLLENMLRGAVALAAVIYVVRVFPKIPHIWHNWRGLVQSPALWLVVAGVVFYILGWPFDKRVFALSEGLALLLEEALELNACMAFCYAANSAGSSADAINAA